MVKDTFTLINNTENGIFFVLKNAETSGGGAEKLTMPLFKVQGSYAAVVGFTFNK